jgi:hypothetical protein
VKQPQAVFCSQPRANTRYGVSVPECCLQKMAEELFALPLEEALPILRAYGHYLK